MMKLNEIDDIDVKVSMIQALIPLGLEAVNENLQKEIMALAGKKHAHGKENVRWAAAGLLALEPRLQKVRGFRYLKLLRAQLQQEIAKRKKKQPLGNATSDDLVAGIHQVFLKLRVD